MIKLIFLIIWLILIFLKNKNWWFGSSIIIFGILLIIRIIPIFESNHYLYKWIIIDFVRFRLIMLRIYITILIINSSWIIKKMNYFRSYFLMRVILLLLVLLMCFSRRRMIIFYFFFELSLIPTLFIIIGWGFQLERIQAGIYFLFYTISASLPLLINLIYFYLRNGSFSFILIMIAKEGWSKGVLELFFFLRIIIAFLVKLPIFFTHLWLPKAHVEAPVSGSIILAGVLLKLGGYGMIRIIPVVVTKIIWYSFIFISLGLLSMVVVGLICWRLNDLKSLVAYSSVAHIGLIICGLISLYIYGSIGVVVLIIGHGLSSSGIFCLVNMIYERLRSRRLYLNKGILLIFPPLRYIFFILCAANISAPPTINLLGEIFLLISVIGFRFLVIIVFMFGSFFGAVFTLFLYSFRQHGKVYKLSERLVRIFLNEYHRIMIHLVPLNILILNMNFFNY